MTSSAFWAYGSTLKLGDGAASEAFTSIAEIQDITPPPLSRDDIEVTSQDSSNGYREFIPGWRDGGEVEFKCNWLPTNTTQDETTGILESFNDDVIHHWQIILPGAIKTISFSGFLTGFEPDLPLEDKADLAVKIRVTGKPTIA